MSDSVGDSPRLPPGYRLLRFGTVGSTNDEARRLAMEGAPDGTLVWAETQTAGRGRRGRAWVSPPGNLHFSLILRPQANAARSAQLSLLAAVVLGDALSAMLPDSRPVRFKWPNDVLLDGAKLAGILLESSGSAGGVLDWVVLGCGVNVAHAPQLADYPAVSLHAAGVGEASAASVLERVVAAFDPWRQRWQNDGIGPVREAWLARAHGLGGPIRVRLADGEIGGRFADMNGDGALVVETGPGTHRVVTAGDVFF